MDTDILIRVRLPLSVLRVQVLQTVLLWYYGGPSFYWSHGHRVYYSRGYHRHYRHWRLSKRRIVFSSCGFNIPPAYFFGDVDTAGADVDEPEGEGS